MKKHNLDRRLFLKGAGSVLIGLPLLEENLASKAFAATGDIPMRLVTMSFGLGIDKELQDEMWDGSLAPLQPFANKMAMFSNLRNEQLRGGGTAHFEVGASLFTGIKQEGVKQANGPSLEQIARRHLHPNGVPSVNGLLSKSAGIWSRTGAVPQYVRHWNADGSPGERPERRPSKVFDAIFGSVTQGDSGSVNLEVERERRIRKSILDSVVADYQGLVGVNSYLGYESKQRISNQLDTIRAIEKSLIDSDLAAAEIENGESSAIYPNKNDYKDPSGISFYDASSGPTTGPVVDWQVAQQAFRLIGKLYALGLSTDTLRFGSLIFVGAGEHIRFSGNYEAESIGQSLNFSNVFKSRSPHDGIFHNYVKSSIRVYQYYVLSQLAYALSEMDSIVEANGKTLLDNTLVVMGTEYGKNHETERSIFHAIVGGNGKFKAGRYNTNWDINDVYKTALDAYNIEHGIGGRLLEEVLR